MRLNPEYLIAIVIILCLYSRMVAGLKISGPLRDTELFRGYPLNTKTPDQLSCYTYFVRVHLTTMILSRPFSLFGSDLRTVKVELKMCGWNRADC